jgi:uncharacterized surface protein with fasciclin (FAS1) repeats
MKTHNRIRTALVAALMTASVLGVASLAFAGQQKVEVPKKDIVETAVAAGDFKTLVAAVQAAGLEATLKGKGPFTVFAPTDAAFAKLPAGTVEALLKDKEALASILTYHVVAGRAMAADVVKQKAWKTVQGQEISVVAGEKGVTIDGSNVLKTDIACSNGVIHVIDTVILPKQTK